MPIRGDNDVVMHGDTQPFSSINNLPSNLDVLPTWRRVSGWMVVNQNQTRRSQLHRPLYDLAYVDGRLIDRAIPHMVIPQ